MIPKIDIDGVKKTWEGNPIFWTILGLVGLFLAFIVIKWFVGLVWTIVGYTFGFGMLGIVLYAADFHAPWKLKVLSARNRRLWVAGGIAILWAGYASHKLLSFQFLENLLLACWSGFILFVAFSVGSMLMKNKDAIVQGVDDIVNRRVDPLEAARKARDGLAGAVTEGVADARKATTG